MDGPSHPPETHAAKVNEALQVLSLGDGRLQEADRFLAAIRVSPTVWSVLHALIHSPSSQLSLTFAARTLYTRLRADWVAFDHSARSAAFSLALDGAIRCTTVLQPSASPVYFFSRAIGFSVSQSAAEVRNAMWRALHEQLTDPILRCHVLAAVANEIDQMSTRDVARHMETRTFCVEKASDVIPVAMRLLQPPIATSEGDAARLRSGVACLQAWCKYGQKSKVAMVLMPVLALPQHADIVEETLTEIVGYSGTELDLLESVCDGLTLAFQSADATTASVVHHAVAEVACALSEGNADELMERESEESRIVVGKVTEVLWLCLKSPDDRAFCAALEGWGCWIAAENLVDESHRKLGRLQIALLVGVVVERMKSLRFIEAAINQQGHDVMESVDERGFVTDLLLQAALSIGVGEFVNAVSPMLLRPGEPFPNGICASLMALAIAGEATEGVLHDAGVREIVLGMLERVMGLLESCGTNVKDEMACAGIRRAALHTLSCYASALTWYSSEGWFYRAVRCAGTSILDEKVCEEGAKLLCDLGEISQKTGGSGRLVGFLPELISSCKGALHRMPKSAAEKCVKGLGRVAGSLPSHEARMKAMDELLSEMCEAVRWVATEQRVEEHESTVCRNLTMIGAALYEMNDSEASGRIFESLRPAVFSMSMQHCGKADISSAICQLLEVCVLPTLLDDEDESRKRNGEGRMSLAICIAELAGECFRRSVPHGETCWLTTLGDVTEHVLWGAECGEGRAEECLTRSVGRALEGLSQFCKAGYGTRADMTVGYLRLVNRLVRRVGGRLVPFAAGMAHVGLGGLRCGSAAVVRESLAFWRLALAPHASRALGEALLAAGGGPAALAGGAVCGAGVERCAGGVADVLFALCRVVGGGDVGVLRALLTEAFAADGVPRHGLDRGVRERLFRGCYGSAGSKRELRQALGEVGRACAMAMR